MRFACPSSTSSTPLMISWNSSSSAEMNPRDTTESNIQWHVNHKAHTHIYDIDAGQIQNRERETHWWRIGCSPARVPACARCSPFPARARGTRRRSRCAAAGCRLDSYCSQYAVSCCASCVFTSSCILGSQYGRRFALLVMWSTSQTDWMLHEINHWHYFTTFSKQVPVWCINLR